MWHVMYDKEVEEPEREIEEEEKRARKRRKKTGHAAKRPNGNRTKKSKAHNLDVSPFWAVITKSLN